MNLVRALLGCDWGWSVVTVDDPAPCQERAVATMVLHDGHAEADFKLCARHRDRVLGETTPHQGET